MSSSMKDANMIRMLLCYNIKIGNDLQIFYQKFEKRENIKRRNEDAIKSRKKRWAKRKKEPEMKLKVLKWGWMDRSRL